MLCQHFANAIDHHPASNFTRIGTANTIAQHKQGAGSGSLFGQQLGAICVLVIGPPGAHIGMPAE